MSFSTAQFSKEAGSDGAFVRQRSGFTGRITADGSSGYPGAAGRYHLYVSLACPWAHRQLIVRQLKGLQDAISVTVADPIRDERGWRFVAGPGHGRDDVAGFDFLREAYEATAADYRGRVTVPAVWDRQTARVVTNDFRIIDIQLNDAFDAVATNSTLDLYPADLRAQIDALDEDVYRDVNNGVYRAGFATSQSAYEAAFDALFARLEQLDAHLADHRYLVGDRLTLADIRLFTTLVRFDAVYVTHFKCNLRRLVDHRHLWPYARDLFATPGFGDTTNFDHIKRHYFQTHERINPSRIVAKGFAIDWTSPHDREQLGPATVAG